MDGGLKRDIVACVPLTVTHELIYIDYPRTQKHLASSTVSQSTLSCGIKRRRCCLSVFSGRWVSMHFCWVSFKILPVTRYRVKFPDTRQKDWIPYPPFDLSSSHSASSLHPPASLVPVSQSGERGIFVFYFFITKIRR